MHDVLIATVFIAILFAPGAFAAHSKSGGTIS
jgi:hypothetical protein